MAQNQGKSANLQIAMHRLDSLLQEGFSRRKLANMTEIKYGTLGKIINGSSKDITQINYDKIEKVYFDYLDRKYSERKYVEDIIDSQDAEEGAREVAKWLSIAVIIAILALVGLGFVVRYIIGLL
jgi:transcriptional regulator with XRE-family HTH domain